MVAVRLVVLAALSLVVVKPVTPPEGPAPNEAPRTQGETEERNSHAFPDIRRAYLIVFLASFCGMTLELTASRVLAQYLGVSLFTWTGIIGVMLAGTALGNFTGGQIADRPRRGLALLAAWPAAALAQDARDHLLSSVSVSAKGNCEAIDIRFNRPVTLTSQFPAGSSTEISLGIDVLLVADDRGHGHGS